MKKLNHFWHVSTMPVLLAVCRHVLGCVSQGINYTYVTHCTSVRYNRDVLPGSNLISKRAQRPRLEMFKTLA